jgi:hypothetical protein
MDAGRALARAGAIYILEQTKHSKWLDSKRSKQITQDIHAF